MARRAQKRNGIQRKGKKAPLGLRRTKVPTIPIQKSPTAKTAPGII